MAEVPSSKVTVTYWDPSSVFPLIEKDIKALLPLRNLHWKSPTRPLRSISSLQVELVPYTGLTPQSVTNVAGSKNSSTDLSASRSGELDRRTSAAPKSTGVMSRRHQIPGLRQTPYLKVYIFRCDDTDTYRATARKMVRDWMATHVTGASSGPGGSASASSTSIPKDGAGGHDAFEWLIIHVVLPGTSAAMQPRTSSSSAAGGAASRGWMKGSQTLLEKIKHDFNGTSKSAKDHVVQIRVPSSHPDLSTLSPPVPLTPPIISEPQAESEAAWQELISRMKNLILASFDARVGQYEEDVREKDSQRALPGWNFCTFFLLKEGLARAFESVGLVEDALAIYDELDCGLDSVTGDEGTAVGGFEKWTTEVLNFLRDTLARRERLLKGELPEEILTSEFDLDKKPVQAAKKPYRELILSNQISEFDFRTYIFSRQLVLLLRLGGSSPVDGEDLHALAEVCRRGVAFINSVARVLQGDILNAWETITKQEEGSEKDPQLDLTLAKQISNTIVASWRYAVARQLVQETTSKDVPLPPAAAIGGPPGGFLKRSSSLPATPTGESFPWQQAITPHRPPDSATGPKSGLEPLAGGRGELLEMMRLVLEGLAKRRGWFDERGWLAVPADEPAKMEVIDLNDDTPLAEKSDSEDKDKEVVLLAGTLEKTLFRSMLSKTGFYKLCGELAENALKHFILSGRERWAMKVQTDMVGLKFTQGDVAGAVENLDTLTQFYSNELWGSLETSLLVIQAKCLKQMDKKQEYLKVLLRLLSKSAGQEKDKHETRPGTAGPRIRHEEDRVLPVEGYVREVVALGHEVEKELSVDMNLFFSDVKVDQYPRALQDVDGFALTLTMRYLLGEELDIEGVKVKLVCASGQHKDVILEHGPAKIRKGIVKLELTTNTSIQASYLVERIEIRLSNNVIFVRESFAKTAATTPLDLVGSNSAAAILSAKASRITFWPSIHSLQVKLEMPETIRLDKVRAVELSINTGRNKIQKAELRIKSATPGLRLITGDAQVTAGNAGCISKTAKPGVLQLMDLEENEGLTLKLPYMAENDQIDLALKIEIEFTTEKGTFLHLSVPKVAMALPLSVNAQDVFKKDSLFSKFQISTASNIPLRIYKTDLSESETFKCSTSDDDVESTIAFRDQPASYVFKIERKKALGAVKETPLEFAVYYSKLDDEIRAGLESTIGKALKEADLEGYTPLVIPPAQEKVVELGTSQFEMAALLGWIKLDSLGYPWTDALATLASTQKTTLETFLKNFVQSHTKIPLSPPPLKTILIPVEVPTLPLLFTASLDVDFPTGSKPLLTTGQPISCNLRISTTMAWSPPRANAKFECIFEIQAPYDMWLVGGRKRANFSAYDGAIHEFPLLLVPVRAGELLLPGIEIKVVDWGNLKPEQAQGSMEVDLITNSCTVKVLPDVRSTVVRIEGGGLD